MPQKHASLDPRVRQRLRWIAHYEQVTKKFRLAKGGELIVFSDFSLDIDAGSFTAILGASGCGKTTLLRLLAGLDLPDAGRIVLGDPLRTRGPRVGLMLQQYPSLPWPTVRQNVELALRSGDLTTNGSRARERALYYLSRVGLVGWENAYPRELSGGMLQRLALARTLAMEPDVVLLDEPLGALDALTRRDLQSLVRDLHQQDPRTFIMVTHDVDEALAIADRVIVLGPAGRGMLYDSAQSNVRLDREGLVRLLRGMHFTFAAGTWSGYMAVREAAIAHGTRVYDFWLGLSDRERMNALRSGRVDGAFFTIQALVEIIKELQDIDPVVVHAFSRPAIRSACERVVIRRDGGSTTQFRWAIPGAGLEKAIVIRLDPEAFPDRVAEREDRAECVLAVHRGDADACVADERFVRELVPLWRRRRFELRLLPDDVWPDLWTVLVTSRRNVSEERDALGYAVMALGRDASSVTGGFARDVSYLNAEESLRVLRDGTIASAFARWGGSELPIDTSLLDAIVNNSQCGDRLNGPNFEIEPPAFDTTGRMCGTTENMVARQDLLHPVARAHRARLQHRLKNYAKLPSWSRALGNDRTILEEAPDLFAPTTLHPVTGFLDSLCTLLDTAAGTIGIFHARRSRQGPEGLGRTALYLHLLGLELAWDACAQRQDHEPMPNRYYLRQITPTDVRLVASDWAYLGYLDGRLVAVPPLGERVFGLWDLARHTYRMMDAAYYPGKRLRPEGRRALDTICRALPAEEFVIRYSDDTGARTIDVAIVLELTGQRDSGIQAEQIVLAQAWPILRTALTSVLFLDTPFWSRQAGHHEELVDRVLGGIVAPPFCIDVHIPLNAIELKSRGEFLGELFSTVDEALRDRTTLSRYHP